MALSGTGGRGADSGETGGRPGQPSDYPHGQTTNQTAEFVKWLDILLLSLFGGMAAAGAGGASGAAASGQGIAGSGLAPAAGGATGSAASAAGVPWVPLGAEGGGYTMAAGGTGVAGAAPYTAPAASGGGGLSAGQWAQLLQGGSKLASGVQGQPRQPQQFTVPEVAPYQTGGGQTTGIMELLRALFPQDQGGGAGDFGGGY